MYGYRRRRSAQQAVAAVHEALRAGYTDVVDADLSKYFDTIRIRTCSNRSRGGSVTGRCSTCSSSGSRHRSRSGTDGTWTTNRGSGSWEGHAARRGHFAAAGQRGHDRFLRAWRERGMARHLKATVVSYADDFVILCRGTAAEALAVTARWMRALKLTLNEKKTRVCDATQTPFDFLGYTFGPTVHRPTGRTYLAAQPSRKATARLRERVRTIRSGNQAPWRDVVRQVNWVVAAAPLLLVRDRVEGVLGAGPIPALPRARLSGTSAQTPAARDAALHSGMALR